jgi:hypothetical protein
MLFADVKAVRVPTLIDHSVRQVATRGKQLAIAKSAMVCRSRDASHGMEKGLLAIARRSAGSE